MTKLRTLEQQAQYFASLKDMAKVKELSQQILALKPDHPAALDQLSKQAMEQGEFPIAEKHLAVLSRLYPDNSILMIKLGYVQEKQGKLKKALATYLNCHTAYPENPIIYLYLGYIHGLLGDEKKAAEIFSLGEDIDSNLLKAHLITGTGDIMRVRSLAGDRVVRKILTKLHLKTIKARDKGGDLKRIQAAIWPQTDDREYQYREKQQQPHLFYIPDLRPRPVYGREDLDWAENIESHFKDIKQEVLANFDLKGDGKPYIPSDMPLDGEGWEKIVGKMTWASIHLYNQGKPDKDNIAKFPLLMQVLKDIPLAQIEGNPSEIFLSVLEPGARIPAHFGVSNNLMTIHFPLVVPEGCGLGVRDQVLSQKEGEVLAFDDTFTHEAWNESNAIRVVLIFEVWHPDLTDKEKEAITATFNARIKWLADRKVR